MTLSDRCEYIIELIDEVLDTTPVSSPRDDLSRDHTVVDPVIASGRVTEPARA